MLFRPLRRPQRICALDVGTTKICAIIGELDGEGRLSALGVGSSRSSGMIRGDVTDIEQTTEAILRAVSQAEELAGVSVRDVVVGIAGDHIQSINADGMVEISHPERGIDEKDRDRAIRKARDSMAIPMDKDILHCVPQSFTVNGRGRVLNPIGLSSHRLEVRLHLILTSVAAARNIIRCVRRSGLRLREVVLESLASSASVLSEHERELGVLLLDIGGGTTDAAVFKHGCIRATGEAPLAGNSITQDIQIMWKTSFHDAERLKKKLGTALPMSVDADEMVPLPTLHPNQASIEKRRRELAHIIEARIEEILTMVKTLVEKEIPMRELHAGVALTGGTAMLSGIEQVAERVFGQKCRVAYPQGIGGIRGVLSSPIYSTAVGLLHFGHGEELNALSSRAGWWARLMQGWIDAYA